MLSVNKVMMAGNLARDPRVRQTTNGTAVGTFVVALNERYTTREGELRETVSFVEVETWGKLAETCGDRLSKGARVFVEGRLRCERWEDRQTGQPRSRLLVRADRVQFLAPGGRTAEGEASNAAKPGAPPWKQSRPAAAPAKQPAAAA